MYDKIQPVEGLPRTLEQVIGLAGLAAAGPVLAAAGVAIAATSQGPVLFRQQRVGRFGKPFTLYKLRTMRVENEGPGFTAKGDSRVTTVGKILRKTKLDELPELWNVIMGDLSLVGPRPEVQRYVDMDDPSWREVLQSRPGLTHPVTLELRNEEELLSGQPDDPARFYVEKLVPYKLRGYLRYQRSRTWRSDLKVLVETALVVVIPGLAEGPSSEDLTADSPG
jgi:lipopolysaccharide/colanic/teichoic acid biosynthesis glycosyltransferase